MAGLYKNAPLVNTAFESRFFGDLAIEARRDQFQKAIRAEFPRLYVPNATPGIAPALQHYQFRNEDNSTRVSLAVNSFVYSTSRYPGFEAFKAELEKNRQIFDNIFDIQSFTRLGLRYTNQLPIIRGEAGAIQLSKYVTAKFQASRGFPNEHVKDVVFSVSCKMEGGDLRILMQNEQREGLEVLTLDFDFSRQGSIDMQEIPQFIDIAHRQIEAAFLDLISADYKEIMKGGS
jgi:uncharacterized protein (TIGR04255 family)